ncbi:MAG: GyrI-like domain-containing protein [Pseudomonadales bacterium]
MRPIDRALWYIESHYREPIALDELADVAGVSRYHLSRSFCYAVGLPASRYLRLRRLSLAAIALANGEPDILDLALSLGYGSHEAFARAFKEAFARTPEQVRRAGHTENLKLLEAMLMNESLLSDLEAPNLTHSEPRSLIGRSKTYTFAGAAEIPGQWQAFAPHVGTIAGRIDTATYGVIHAGTDEGYDYLSGVAVAARTPAPDGMIRLDLPAQTYAVFRHPGHVSEIRRVCNTIWSEWLPESGYQAVEAPWFERYPPPFDPQTGAGGFEIWIPVDGG